MGAIAAVWKRELRVHFFCLSNFILFALFTSVAGLFFYANLSDWSAISLGLKGTPPNNLSVHDVITGPFFMNLCLISLSISPLLSSRAFSDEKRYGTFELLFTYPVRDIELVVGKWIAIMFQLTCYLIPAVIFLASLNQFGLSIPFSVIGSGFLGIWLASALAVSLGIFFSAVSYSQALAFALNLATLLFFWTNGWLADLFLPKFGRLMSEFWIAYHMKEFASGIIDTNRILFYGLATTLTLILSMLSLELRAWKR